MTAEIRGGSTPVFMTQLEMNIGKKEVKLYFGCMLERMTRRLDVVFIIERGLLSLMGGLLCLWTVDFYRCCILCILR